MSSMNQIEVGLELDTDSSLADFCRHGHRGEFPEDERRS